MIDTPINVPVSANSDTKPAPPAAPQTQANTPKPADKPSEQQK
jgi:hypothetical protein